MSYDDDPHIGAILRLDHVWSNAMPTQPALPTFDIIVKTPLTTDRLTVAAPNETVAHATASGLIRQRRGLAMWVNSTTERV